MKRMVLLIAGLCSIASAGLPVQDMSLTTLGLDYNAMWRGERITNANVGAHENTHFMTLHYSPIKYVALSGGLGVANYIVDTYQQVRFCGSFALAPAFGLDLYSPRFFKELFRVTAGGKGYYLNSRNSARSFKYQGFFINPCVGLIATVNSTTDIEAGVRGHLIAGRMSEGETNTQDFSNINNIRLYGSVLIHTPAEGIYFIFDFDASPEFSTDWSKGPEESSIGFSVGCLLRKKEEKSTIKTEIIYPEYRNLQKKKEEMQKEINE
jgi:hypothetical protein